MGTFLLRSAIALGLTLGVAITSANAAPPNGYFRFGRLTITNQPAPGTTGFSCFVDSTYPRSVSSGQFAGDGRNTAKLAMENISETMSSGSGFKAVIFPGTLILNFKTAGGGTVGLQGYGESVVFNGGKTALSRTVQASFSGFASSRTPASATVSFTLQIPAGDGFSACRLGIRGTFFP